MKPTGVTQPRTANRTMPRPVASGGSPIAVSGGPSLARDQYVASGKGAPPTPPVSGTAPVPIAPQPALKDRILENRQRLARVLEAEQQAGSDPAARAVWRQEAEHYFDWLTSLERVPSTPATSDDILEAWMGKAADQVIRSRGLTTPAARLSTYQQLLADVQAKPTRASKAMLAAATTGVLPSAPVPLGATSQQIQGHLAPAVLVLAASKSPLAQELAQKIRHGEIELDVSSGQSMGVQYYAVVKTSKITLSNGEKGPDFFRLSPPYQASTLLHEYAHVKQKQQVGGFLNGLKGNLLQRALSLPAVLGADGERMESNGKALNENEQAAYRIQKAFLVEMGVGAKGVTPEDAGALVGIDSWLEAARR